MSKTKYSQLFRFLKAYYQLREATAKDITTSRKYQHICWLEEISRYEGARSRLLEQEMEEEALLLALPRPKRPVEPERPEVKERWKYWLEGRIFELESAPGIRDIIELDGEMKLLEQDPGLEEELDKFLKTLSQWKEQQAEYLELFAAYEAEKRTYDKFFDAANKLDAFSERYELLLGVGLFCWQASPAIRRPLVTIPLEIEISDTGFIRVSLSAEQQLFQIENDFLSGLPDFSLPAATAVLQEKLSDEEPGFWEALEMVRITALQAFASNLSADTEYNTSEYPPESLPAAPVIYYAPVILFRERSLRSFTVLFDSILQHLDAQEEHFQLGLLDRVVYSLGQLPAGRSIGNRSWQVSDEEIILPRESNAEQMQIARRIGQRDVVLVQGPPGTGKSHTIANIITYLLSQGKKVLVTAQTDQALKALRNHLPEAFLDLVIYFLEGSNRRESELAKSVRQLQESINSYQPAETAKQIARYKQQLQTLREERAELINDIKALQQADSRPAHLNQAYSSDTLLALTSRIIEEEARFSWMKSPITSLPEALGQCGLFAQWHELFSSIRGAGFSPEAQPIPDPARLVAPAELKRLKECREEYQAQYEGKVLLTQVEMEPERLKALADNFSRLSKLQPAADGWRQEVRQALRCGNDGRWRKLAQRSEALIKGLVENEVEELVRQYEFSIPAGISPRQLKADAAVVRDYVNQGKKLSGVLQPLLLPKEIKNRRYIFEACRVNNHPCLQASELEVLARYAEIQLALTEMDELWAPYEVQDGDPRRKLEAYQSYQAQLTGLLEHYPAYLSIRNQLQGIFQQPEESWERPEAAFLLQKAVHARFLQEEVTTLRKKVANALEYLESLEGESENLSSLKQSLALTDWIRYEEAYAAAGQLSRLNDEYRSMQQAEEGLAGLFHETIGYLHQAGPVVGLDKEEIERAVYWSNAHYELAQRFSDSIDDKYRALARNEADFREVALNYLKSKAASSFIEDLKSPEELNRQLTRWTQAVRQAGGKGKLSFQYRRKAQSLLQGISRDIPCWIMPMYRLVDTLGPEPETFDVVIIDEASQLGPEALFLKYITQKIIVVGDDQQTAPENVGVQIEQVNDLIRTHLSGIPDQEFYNTKHSFFEHVDALAGQRISLKEHFRCMPEIIEFSNQLCYRPQGIELVPLKQYSSKRLDPLVKYFVPKGTFENDRNLPEARAIVESIKYLLTDEAYEGKTFGIIALQGTNQSIEIDRLLREEIAPKDFQERKIVCGTPPDFQGDERDVVFLSLVTAHDHRRRSLTGDSHRRRFNVAMSRAKEQVWLFHSVQEEDLNPIDFRYQLLHYFNTKNIGAPQLEISIPDDRSQRPPKPFDSWFEVDIYQELSRRNYVVEPQYKVGPYRIDLVVHLPNGKKIAVECDGDRYHEGEALQNDIDRQLILERAKWEFFRLRWSHYKYEPEEALKKLWILLETRSQETVARPGLKSGSGTDDKSMSFQSQKDGNPFTEPAAGRSWEKDRGEAASNTLITNDGPVEMEDGQVDLLVFTDQARVHIHKAIQGSEVESYRVDGQLQAGEAEIYRVATVDYSGFMAFCYSNGKVDRVGLSAYKASRSVLQNAYHKEQKLLLIRHFQSEVDLVGITDEHKVIVFSTGLVSEHSSRGNQGNQVFRTGSRVKKYKVLEEASIADPEYYRRNTTNARGYYLKEGDRV